MLYIKHTLLLSAEDRFHLMLISLTLAILPAAAVSSAVGVPVAVCLLVVMLAPFVTVVGYETIGHQHQQQMLKDLHEQAS